MLNALSFDIEEWHHRNDFEAENRYTDRVVANTEKILELLLKKEIKATFFILGCVAEKYPRLVSKISHLGHEVATHGYGHELVYKQGKDQFREDLRKSILILEDITGRKILGYRAPSWSITKDSLWALDIIQGLGLRYDSSIFPIKTFIYGIPDAHRFIHKIKNDLLEFPPSVIRKFGKNIPFAGGVFFRISPLVFIKFGINQINQLNRPAMLNLHPWDMDNFRPKLRLPPNKILRYYLGFTNLKTTEKKLAVLLNNFRFGPIKEVLNIT